MSKNRNSKRLAGKRRRLAEEYGWVCFYCKDDLMPETATIDHYIPIVLGGKDLISNMRLACTSCNFRKSDLMPRDFTPAFVKDRITEQARLNNELFVSRQKSKSANLKRLKKCRKCGLDSKPHGCSLQLCTQKIKDNYVIED